VSHFVQVAWSIACRSNGASGIAFTGQCWAQIVQPVQASVIV
jgi:hypothetical protein